ncbi:hypothetical protein KVG88_00595 [Pseudomonas sp. SWRI74]|uniref:Phage tail protein n=1 Tax=Pseudomonas azerbaijanoccidentalis TaxID=2842347 RepID=A0ABS6QI00_9PSED|nr:hypothetical protein [Pseudomonas azerbaijanoccidentalis]MBV4518546.1 hypothetical protein [Pseudomonas azerbaijanoccidentalis]
MSGNIDWSQLITKAAKDAEVAAAERAAAVQIEDAWRLKETAFIADQLIGIEDGDPAALPGTEAEWRAYRTKVRNWKEGAQFFPDLTHRPIRPA